MCVKVNQCPRHALLVPPQAERRVWISGVSQRRSLGGRDLESHGGRAEDFPEIVRPRRFDMLDLETAVFCTGPFILRSRLLELARLDIGNNQHHLQKSLPTNTR